MQDALNDVKKFLKLEKDPREEIKKKIKAAVCTYAEEGLLSPEDVFAISGVTRRGGMSHGHEFVIKKPHMYLLFKIHKLSQDKIKQKVIPPTRMVTSGVGGPTFRLGTFLDNILKPVVSEYCKGEVLKDSADFLSEIDKMEKSGQTQKFKFIGTLDVDALYPNIRLDLAVAALKDALDTVTDYSVSQKNMIAELVKICIENSVVHYRGSWYRSLLGLPTGGPESGSCANLFVFFVLEKILLVHPTVAPLNCMSLRKRFLDDLWFAWSGTHRQFDLFKAALNKVGLDNGMTFKGNIGTSIDFLDVSVTLRGTHFSTKMYVKPTDASRYLHRRSDHARHTFKSIPYTQFRRAVLLCSEDAEKNACIEYIENKLKNSGYKINEIEDAKKRALSLDRCELLKPRRNKPLNDVAEDQRQLTFTVNRDDLMSKQIRSILKDNQTDINKLLGGPTRLIVAERKNNSTASLMFGKSSFSKCLVQESENQECGKGGCLTCGVIGLKKKVTLWKDQPERKTFLKLDFRCNCITENCIYLYVCKLCKSNEGFYIGQTTNTCRQRANGHRSDFNFKDYKKSALSYHIYQEHPDHIMEKLNNYELGIIKTRNPMDLDRAEDYFVDLTNADLSLNRYKVTTY